MDIFKIITLILSVISTSVIPLIFALKRAKTDFASAKNDADKEKSIVDMIDVVRQLIEIVEKTYSEATGQEKKSTVLMELEDYAKKQNYAFDIEYWGTVIDNLVSMTNKVNIHK